MVAARAARRPRQTILSRVWIGMPVSRSDPHAEENESGSYRFLSSYVRLQPDTVPTRLFR